MVHPSPIAPPFSMIISNPIYDVVFKLLMSETDIAKEIISRVIGRDVLKLNLSHQEHAVREHTKEDGESITLMRMDFSALIKDEFGKEIQVLIEIQKAKLTQDLTRFRRYLGSQYLKTTDIEEAPDFINSTHLPIFTIYLINFCLDVNGKVHRQSSERNEPEDHFHPPFLRISRTYKNAVTNELLPAERQSDFIEALTHDAFVVQIPRLPDVPKTPLERAFSLFNQRLIREDKHRLILEGEASLSPKDALTEKMARVLFKISASKEIEERMNQEDILQEDIERSIKKLEHDIKEVQKEKEEAQKRESIERKEKQEAQKEKEEAQERESIEKKEKEVAQKEKEEAQKEKEGILQQAIQALMKTGLSEENARKALNLS